MIGPAPKDDSALNDALKRCSPETAEAARLFRRTRDTQFLPKIIHGVIERYVERDLRFKLSAPSDNLRLVEDLAIDSLSLFEIALATEDVLNITIETEDLGRMRTLGDVTRFLVEKFEGGRRLSPA